MFIEPGVLHDVVGILGDPTPMGSIVRYNTTCRPSGALGYLVYAVFYKHAAPLGLNAAQFGVRHHRKGLVSSPNTQCVAL